MITVDITKEEMKAKAMKVKKTFSSKRKIKSKQFPGNYEVKY